MQKRIALIALSFAVVQLSATKVEPKPASDATPQAIVAPQPESTCCARCCLVQKVKNGFNWTTAKAGNACTWTVDNSRVYGTQALTYAKAHKTVSALVAAGAVTAVVATVYLVKALRTKKAEPVSVNV